MKNKYLFHVAAELPKTSCDVNNVLAGNIFQGNQPVRLTPHEARADCKEHISTRFNNTVGFGPREFFRIETPTVDVVHHLRAENFSEQNIRATTFYIGADFLHDEQEIMQRFNKGRYKPERLQNGRYIDAKEILERRTIELVALQHALENTPERLRKKIKVDNKTEKSWRMLYTHAEYRRQDSKPIDNPECKKMLDDVHKYLQKNLDAYTSSHYCDIMAIFDAQFDSIGGPPDERVARAMSATVGVVQSKMPAIHVPLREVFTQASINGLVNGMVPDSAMEDIADEEARAEGTSKLYKPEDGYKDNVARTATHESLYAGTNDYASEDEYAYDKYKDKDDQEEEYERD